MLRFALCAAILCLPLGCMTMPVDDDGDETSRLAPPGPFVPPARPHGPCKGQECNGRVPFGAGCLEDAEEITARDLPARKYGRLSASAGELALVHSPSCGAYWARVSREDRGYSIAWVETEGGAGEVESTTDRRGAAWDSLMFDASSAPLRACVQALPCKKACDTQYATTYCTDYR